MSNADLKSIDVEPLFKPLRVGGLELSNRFGMSPMTRYFSPDGVPSEGVAAYYRRRAEGGVGLIITEGTHPDLAVSHNRATTPHFYGEHALQAWRKVVDEVHAGGGKIFPQLWHCGALRSREQTANPDAQSLGPSESYPLSNVTPRAMTESEVGDVIEAFATAAADAKRIGFDGVAIHGAHGYLFDAFLWDQSNKRNDRYGGDSLKDRIALSTETVRAIRRRVGKDFPIMWRYSQWKLTPLDAKIGYQTKLADTPQQLAEIVEPLAEAGVDIFDPSTRRFWEPAFEGSDLTLSGWTKKISGKPTSTVGSVGLQNVFSPMEAGTTLASDMSSDRLKQLVAMLERGDFDLVLLGRALLSNPDWPNKVRAGAYDQLRPFRVERAANLEPAEY